MPLRNDVTHRLPQMNINSKLPDVGTTIFTVMSALAAKHNAINLSQGFPDFDPRTGVPGRWIFVGI